MHAPDFIAAVWSLLLARPQLLADHMGGYAALMREEAELAIAYIRYRLCLWVAFITCGLAFFGLAGIALMLWGTTPNNALVHAWVLVLVPTIPLVGAVLAGVALMQGPPRPLWMALQGQIAADMTLLNAHVS
jgi:hypothetical protein